MNYVKLTLFFALITNLTFGQNLDYENQVIREHKKEIKSQIPQAKTAGNISGTCDAITTITNQEGGYGWDDCEGETYEGSIEFESIDGERYNIYSDNLFGSQLNDLSFGSYFACYGTTTQGGMPNGDASNPTLYFNVDESGEFSFVGSSQWDEIFSISDIVLDGAQFNFNWVNDYGEGASVQLERQDGQSWEDLLIPCYICSESDSLALVALYNATDGPNWNIPWDLNKSVESWYGVKLNSDCCVSEINLGPSEQLSNLGFDNNNLVGTIPDEIGDLTNLTVLDLSNNFLPAGVFYKFTSLVNLEMLDLSDNFFEGVIPAEIGDMTNLTFLDLSNNGFEGTIADEIGNLTNLTFLDLSENFFTGEIVSKIINLVNIETLILASNSFEGTISSEIDNLQKLDFITLSNNNMEGEIPPSLGNIPDLRIFYASLNNLEGELPSEIGQLTNLIQFSTWGNQFSGDIISEFGNLTNLFNLNLDRNNLSGEIPSSLSQLTNLQRLGLAFNQIEGTIPFGLSSVFRVRLNDNNLVGEIPFDFASAFTPSEINLTNNNFTGNIPNRFISDSPFQALYFANNDFSGCIDSFAILCSSKEFNSEIDSFSFGGETFYTYFERGYNFEGNPKLAWEGAIQNACEGQDQIGAPCDDGDPNTSDTGIDGNCNCMPLVSTKDIKELNSITISPNPLSSGEMMNITLDLSNTIDATVKLMDLNGRTITSMSLGIISGTETYSLSIDNLTSGLYFLQVASENGIVSRKIAIQ